MVWDGNCAFCHYWIVRWNKMSGDSIDYRPYNEVADKYPDIEVENFQRAVRFIEPDGRIYSGAAAAYRSFTYGTSWRWLWKIYRDQKWFRKLSNWAYDIVAKNRPFLFKVTRLLFGSNPEKIRPYWLIYLSLILVFILILLF
ncbi:MAG TPA: DCC1-like thiol-disulfide oxidoreductase family protein [Cryomorphaceae bacterium]|nr:DCC1-like thiol-disulfide oxidoreductase family protein [Cryomorphaceae bacterium]